MVANTWRWWSVRFRHAVRSRSLRKPFSGTARSRSNRRGSAKAGLQRASQAPVTYKQTTTSATHSYQPEVVEVLPANLNLDLDFSTTDHLSSCLDTRKLAGAGNSLSKLWSDSESDAQVKLAVLPLAARRPASPDSNINKLALQCALFCSQLASDCQALRSAGRHEDFYVIACLCLKV